MDLIVIDGTPDEALDFDRRIHPGAIQATSVHGMVQHVLARLGQHGLIDRLVIWSHGDAGQEYMGLGPWDGNTIPHPYRRMLAVDPHGHLLNPAELARLTGRFAGNGVVELHGCQVARHLRGRLLLQALANLWKVTARAAIWDQLSDYRNRFQGPVFEATPGRAAHQI